MRRAWGLTIRDGYGQTETTAQIGNSPGQPVKPGSMGRPLPGYDVALLDADGEKPTRARSAVALDPRAGRADGAATRTTTARRRRSRGGYYRTGDVARRDADGYFTYVGRADDVFKASDYRISPFELESALIEHPAVAEAAVVPSPDPLRLAVPKAFVVLAAGHAADARDRAGDLPPRPRAASRPTSASGGSSSPSCRRPSPARSAASSCAWPRKSARAPPTARRTSTAREDFPELRDVAGPRRPSTMIARPLGGGQPLADHGLVGGTLVPSLAAWTSGHSMITTRRGSPLRAASARRLPTSTRPGRPARLPPAFCRYAA